MPVPTRSSSSSRTTSTSLSRSSKSGLCFTNPFIAKEKARQKSKTLPDSPSAVDHIKPTTAGPGEIISSDQLTKASIALLWDYGSIKLVMREEILSRRNIILIHSIYCTIAGFEDSMHAAKECHTLAHDIETWLEVFPKSSACPPELGVGLSLKMLADRFTRRAARMAQYFYRIFIEMDAIIKDYEAASGNATSGSTTSGDQGGKLILLSHTLKHCLAEYTSFWSKVSKHMFPIYVYAKRYLYSIPSPAKPPVVSNKVGHHMARQELDLFGSAQGCRAAYGTFALYILKMSAELLDQFPKLFVETRKYKSYYTR